MNFKDKVVLITGAGAGIGRTTAIMFAEKGAKVVVADRSQKGLETVDMIKKAGCEAIFVQGDISVASDAENMVKEAVKTFGRLDILVNNAGIVLGGRIDDTTEEDFDKTMSVNVKGTFLVSKYAVLEMKKTGGGVIVNVGSIAGLKGITNRCAYSASKGAVISLTRAMAIDLIKDNIRVNCVCPGTTYTQGLAERINAAPDPDAMLAEFVSRQPIGRLGKEEEIAFAILFACCDEAAFMNGSIITIDGGATI